MNRFLTSYRLLNILSIDVALGAVCCAAWFAVLFEVTLRPYALASLGLTVWIIYTIDHLLDARKVSGPASTDRHRFHQKNFTVLLTILVIAIALDLLVVFFVRKEVFKSGIVLSCVMMIYFLLQHHLRHFKEFVIAILFSCGVLLPAWSLSTGSTNAGLALIISQFVLTALLNLLLFSWFDHHNDIKDKRESFVTLIGERASRQIISFLFLLNASLMLATILYSSALINQELIIFLMNFMLAFVFIQRKRFEVNDRFRLVGDCIFLFPVLYFLL
jgi:hypothetical protein